MDYKFIANITPIISLYADDYQYILVIRKDEKQELRNGRHTYHSTIGACFEEILTQTAKSNLADGKDKSLKEISEIMQKTINEIKELFKPFEDLTMVRKG